MKNKLFFRILGALASGLYIFSVFVPLSNISSMTLWDASKGEMYLPIMLIVFGFLGVLLFALNRKIELIYTSVGVALYYLVIQTSTAVGLKVFGNLGMGYYFLLIGTVIMGLMTFICTLKGNETVVPVQQVETSNESIIHRMDTLYGDNNQQEVLNPTLITPGEVINPTLPPVEPMIQPQIQEPIPEIVETPVNGNVPVQPTPVISEMPQPITAQQPNPVISEFQQPAVQPAQVPAQPQPQPVPVVPVQQPQPQPVPVVPAQQPIPITPLAQPQPNPVLSEFSQPNPGQPTIVPAPQPVQPQPQNQNPGVTMDIFGTSSGMN